MPRLADRVVMLFAVLVAIAANSHVTAARSAEHGAVADDPAVHLLDGVHEVAAPGVPGAVAVWGPDAFVIATGKEGASRAPVIAAAEIPGKKAHTRGRIVIFGHTSYLDGDAAQKSDTARLLQQLAAWASHSEVRNGKPIRVGIVGGNLKDALGKGFTVQSLKRESWHTNLADIDLLLLVGGDLEPAQSAALKSHIEQGRGVMLAVTGWGWSQIHKGRRITECGYHQAVAPYGLGWSERTLDADRDGLFAVQSPVSPLTNASAALDALVEQNDGKRELAGDDKTLAMLSVEIATPVLPAADTILKPRLDALLAKSSDALAPTKKHPITAKQPLLRVLLAHQISTLMREPVDHRPTHAAASDFPGVVAPEVPRTTRELTVQTAIPDWHSTGAFANAGEVVTIEIDERAIKAGLRVRIGCHTDTLWHKDKWDRVPDVSWDFPLDKPSTKASTPFGGLVFILVPNGCKAGDVGVKLSNIVEAPLFILGKTTPEEWQSTIRSRSAPWAEIGGDKVIVTVPSSHIRALDDPVELVNVWNEVADAAADLATRPRERTRPERYVADVQISAGYMHSGYPIMTHLAAAADMVSVKALKKGAWGLYHELGHNHQSGDWTFGGTGEVTVNLFSMYIIEKVCGIPHGQTHDAFKNREKSIGVYLAQGAPFEKWKSDPFLALYMYCQLEEAFGWETYKQVFAEYRDLPKDERPKNDDQKRDQWMVRFSRATGKNLGPFFQAWGVPTSDEARASIKDLPEWMPPNFPPK